MEDRADGAPTRIDSSEDWLKKRGYHKVFDIPNIYYHYGKKEIPFAIRISSIPKILGLDKNRARICFGYYVSLNAEQSKGLEESISTYISEQGFNWVPILYHKSKLSLGFSIEFSDSSEVLKTAEHLYEQIKNKIAENFNIPLERITYMKSKVAYSMQFEHFIRKL